jgi:hypothetical protein
MVGTLADGANAAGTTAYRARVGVAMVQVAYQVSQENVNDVGDTSRWNRRRSLSVQALQDPALWQARFAWAIQAQPSARDSAIDDATLVQLVTDLWDAVAGSA